MAKAPQRGAVKRRLASAIGEGEALRFYRSCLAHSLMRLARDPRWTTLLAITPDSDCAALHLPAPRKVVRLPQGRGGLGERMQRLFERLPPGPAVLVGGDIPAMRPMEIARAFRLLGSADIVLGPARDGGYWLVGMRRIPRVLKPFASVRWSSEHALADTLANLKGKRVAFAAPLADVDEKDSYRSEKERAERLLAKAPLRVSSAL